CRAPLHAEQPHDRRAHLRARPPRSPSPQDLGHNTNVRLAWVLAALLPAAAFAATDTDGDGISDEDELGGVSGEPLLDLPRFGADPAVPDIFVVMDWEECDPQTQFCGINNDRDKNRVSRGAVRELAAYFAPDFALHV